MELKIFY